jgi:diaminopimelate epimerase
MSSIKEKPKINKIINEEPELIKVEKPKEVIIDLTKNSLIPPNSPKVVNIEPVKESITEIDEEEYEYEEVTDEDEEISAATNGKVWNGYHISVGNPHAVVFVEDLAEVGALADAPVVRPKDAYPEGVNVEFVEITGEREVKMRVFERGSRETRSCGTGVCAAALAATIHTKAKLPARWIVNPPGGRLEVDIDGHNNATLIGPAVLIADHDISKYLL